MKPCVEHTQAQNLQDRRDRNRRVKKLTESEAQAIKERLKTETGTAIARDLGLSHSTVYGIKNGRYWK